MRVPRTPRLARALAAITICSGVFATSPAHAITEIRVWHSLTGVPAETFTKIVNDFNAEQKNYHVELVFKGSDAAAPAGGRPAQTAPDGPDLLQVSEVLSGEVTAKKDSIRPMYEILPLAKSKDFEFFIPGAVTFMKDERNRLRAFPLEASVPVLLYNKTAFAKAGLPTDANPATWRDLQKELVAIQDAGKGFKCPYTTSDQAWIHIENIGALHGEPIATKNN